MVFRITCTMNGKIYTKDLGDVYELAEHEYQLLQNGVKLETIRTSELKDQNEDS